MHPTVSFSVRAVSFSLLLPFATTTSPSVRSLAVSVLVEPVLLLCVVVQHCWWRVGGALHLDCARSSSVHAAPSTSR